MKNKVIIITGASSGIGTSLAFELAKNNNKLVLASRNKKRLSKIVKEIHDKRIDAIYVQTDVTNKENCKNLIDKTISRYRRIDVLINNAGISMYALFNELDLSIVKKVMNTNFWGTVNCTKYALPFLLKNKGSLIGVSSIAGHIGLPERSAYSASKFAMNGFLESVRCENQNNSLHVLIACPGFTASNIRRTALTKDGTPQKESPRNEQKMMTSEDVAKKIICAIDSKQNTITLTFKGRLIVWINRFFPKLAQRLVFKYFYKEK